MKKLVAIGMVAVGLATMAQAKDEGFYIGGKVALFKVTADMSASWGGDSISMTGKEDFTGFTVAGGYRFNRNLRCEAEFGFVSKSDMDVMTYMGQFYADFPLTDSPVMPYVNAGVGVLSYKETGFSEGRAPCFSVGAGCAFGITDNLFLDAAYRYYKASTIDVDYGDDITGDMKISAHAFLAGLRLAF